ncbi:MAG: hypothetical protein Q4G43_08500 [Mobilicoccus sp.]|nr:hypothetical protein [Mobilicoccus sp.]
MPHPALIVLRTMATLVLSAVIGQAGWAAAALGGETRYWAFHSLGALVTLAVCVVTAIVYVGMRKVAGVVNTVLAVLVALVVGAQYALGEAGHMAEHIFLGVLIAMLATALTSWTYRHHWTPTDR